MRWVTMMTSFSSDLPPVFCISKDKTFRSSHSQMVFQLSVLINFAVSQENTCVESFFTLLKSYSTLAFSCEICKFFKNTYFEDNLRTTASEHYRLRLLSYKVTSTRILKKLESNLAIEVVQDLDK